MAKPGLNNDVGVSSVSREDGAALFSGDEAGDEELVRGGPATPEADLDARGGTATPIAYHLGVGLSPTGSGGRVEPLASDVGDGPAAAVEDSLGARASAAAPLAEGEDHSEVRPRAVPRERTHTSPFVLAHLVPGDGMPGISLLQDFYQNRFQAKIGGSLCEDEGPLNP